jgi:hypothetical protein
VLYELGIRRVGIHRARSRGLSGSDHGCVIWIRGAQAFRFLEAPLGNPELGRLRRIFVRALIGQLSNPNWETEMSELCRLVRKP